MSSVGMVALAQQVGTCPCSLGEAYLNANIVRARIMNTGGLCSRARKRGVTPKESIGNRNDGPSQFS